MRGDDSSHANRPVDPIAPTTGVLVVVPSKDSADRTPTSPVPSATRSRYSRASVASRTTSVFACPTSAMPASCAAARCGHSQREQSPSGSHAPLE